jgi:hypothetical protein
MVWIWVSWQHARTQPLIELFATICSNPAHPNKSHLHGRCQRSIRVKRVDHRRSIWGQLQRISVQYLQVAFTLHHEYLKNFEKPTSDSPDIIANDLPRELQSNIERFQRCIYAFSLKRSKQRIYKPCGKETRLTAYLRIAQLLQDVAKQHMTSDDHFI